MELEKIEVEWMPLEQMLLKEKSERHTSIGFPIEQNRNESRIVITPSEVRALVQKGHKVLIERNLGMRAQYDNHDFASAGALIVDSHSEVFNADIVARISPPDVGEVALMKSNAILLSFIRGAEKDEKFFRSLISNKITAISFEYIKTASGVFPLLNVMEEIAGKTAIVVAASLLADNIDGQGRSLSGFAGIPPAETLILGATEAAASAVSAAMGLGAQVKVLDKDVSKLSHLHRKAGTSLYTGILNSETLLEMIPTIDILICALPFSEEESPDFFIAKEWIEKMKKGSVIVDLTIDCGGILETSHPTSHINPVYKKYNVIHYCVPNITAAVPKTASLAFSNFLSPVLQQIGNERSIDTFLIKNPMMTNGVYAYKGYATNSHFSKIHNLPYKEIDLLMAIFNK